MALSREHRRLLVVEQGVGATLVNFLLNAGIAWALFRSVDRVPLWGQSSIAGDTFATAFLLPLLTCLIVTRAVRRQVAGGRGMLLGIGGVALAAIPTVVWFAWAGPSELPRGSFLWFKASFAAVLAAGVTPLIAWLALASAPAPERPA
jgi:hypothetical protein